MTNNLSDDQLAAILAQEGRPAIVGATAITPSIYEAERVLQIAKLAHPEVVTVLGGVHATFMYQQVVSAAPWIDAIVRGEGEEILVDLVRAVELGQWLAGMGAAVSSSNGGCRALPRLDDARFRRRTGICPRSRQVTIKRRTHNAGLGLILRD